MTIGDKKEQYYFINLFVNKLLLTRNTDSLGKENYMLNLTDMSQTDLTFQTKNKPLKGLFLVYST